MISQEELASGALDECFDVCVCNFSLLGGEVVDRLVDGISARLNPGGALIVQALHPCVGDSEANYRDGWRQGSWAGIDVPFADPAPWYFRTLQAWVKLFRDSRLHIEAMQETRHPETQQLLSIILVGMPE